MPLPWLMIFGLATALIKLAQEIWPKGEGNGKVKKAVVTAAVNAAVNTTGTMLTGGAQQTWQEMGGPQVISDFIDSTVSTLFPDKIDSSPVPLLTDKPAM